MTTRANGVAGPAKNRHDAADEQGHLSTPRRLKPRAPIAVATVYLSQLNCLQTIGVNDRRFLDEVVPLCKGEVTKLGKLRLVPLDVAVQALRTLASTGDEGIEQSGDDDAQPETAAAVLEAIGKELAQ